MLSVSRSCSSDRPRIAVRSLEMDILIERPNVGPHGHGSEMHTWLGAVVPDCLKDRAYSSSPRTIQTPHKLEQTTRWACFREVGACSLDVDCDDFIRPTFLHRDRVGLHRHRCHRIVHVQGPGVAVYPA